jgi:hypothetical protein
MAVAITGAAALAAGLIAALNGALTGIAIALAGVALLAWSVFRS